MEEIWSCNPKDTRGLLPAQRVLKDSLRTQIYNWSGCGFGFTTFLGTVSPVICCLYPYLLATNHIPNRSFSQRISISCPFAGQGSDSGLVSGPFIPDAHLAKVALAPIFTHTHGLNSWQSTTPGRPTHLTSKNTVAGFYMLSPIRKGMFGWNVPTGCRAYS
jgi:hypothetical protein